MPTGYKRIPRRGSLDHRRGFVIYAYEINIYVGVSVVANIVP